MAVDPIGYLVVPRVVACMIMVPILAFYGVVIGIAGGYFVATAIKGLAPSTLFRFYSNVFYHFQTLHWDLVKSSVFGAVIALVGAYRGWKLKWAQKPLAFH